MKIILALVFTILSTASAYQLDNIAISEFEFRRYVKPQLKSITNEFQTLLFALNPELKSYKNSYNLFREVNSINQKFRSDCSNKGEHCIDDLVKLEKILRRTLDELKPAGELTNSADPQTWLTYQHSKEYIYQGVFQAILKAQNMLFQNQIVGNLGIELITYSDQLNYLYDQFNAFLFKSSDPRFANEFNSFWVNFVRPVENFALHQDNRQFFITRMTDLNMRWHMLNVRLTKRSYTPNKQIATLLNIMQRRWNNILKVSLKPKG